MAFRKIRASLGESSASSSDPSQYTSESAGSHTLGEKEAKEARSGGSNASRRRRVPDSVTRNACLNCRKGRVKCDGKNPCTRCATRVRILPCVYEVHVKHAKEELANQIKELKAKDDLREQILGALSTDEQVPEILQRLKDGEAYDSIVEWLGQASIHTYNTPSPTGSQQSYFNASDQEVRSIPSTFRWTAVTSDTAVLDHLFQLYFSWVHPVHTLFSEGYFVNSYRIQSYRYCSTILVDSICAMACHLATSLDIDEVDFEQLGREFSDAVRNRIDPEDRRVTTIQAFAVMFLVDCARGKGLRGSTYLKVASSSLSSVVVSESKGFSEILATTSRGIRSLNVEWAQMTFQVPVPFISVPSKTSKENDEELDGAQWYFYRYVNDQCPAWPSFLATTNREKAKLIDIINDVTTILYGQQVDSVSAHQVLEQYIKYLAWRKELPSAIGDIEFNNSQALPHVLSLLILYSSSVIQLLQPLLHFESFPTATVEGVIWKHAQQGLFLMDQHYRSQYTCRYQPVLQMFAVLHLCDVIARYFPGKVSSISKGGLEAMEFGMEALTQSRAGFPIAGPFRELLLRTANECSVYLPNDPIPSLRPPKMVYMMDDFIDACTRPTYGQPVEDIHHKYQPTFAIDWIAEGPSLGFGELGEGARRLRVAHSKEEEGAHSLMQICNVLNTG